VDILSIGSHRRPELQEAQKFSFGSHVSVRNFFTATEADDADPLCEQVITEQDVYSISKYCRQKPWDAKSYPFMRYMRNNYGRVQWLQQKKNPAGWMCAQRRPIHGLYKVLRKSLQTDNLPDHLIIMDDDTYMNLEAVLADLSMDQSPELPLVTTGCLVRLPIMDLNFTFGFGGYGVIFNKAALQYLIEPIQCPRDTDVCARIQENQIGEALVFESTSDNMGLIDMMQAHAVAQPYRDQKNWTQGYCLHSDWYVPCSMLSLECSDRFVLLVTRIIHSPLLYFSPQQIGPWDTM
jgi:hypothetical protein